MRPDHVSFFMCGFFVGRQWPPCTNWIRCGNAHHHPPLQGHLIYLMWFDNIFLFQNKKKSFFSGWFHLRYILFIKDIFSFRWKSYGNKYLITNITHNVFLQLTIQGSCFGSDEIKALILRFLQQWVLTFYVENLLTAVVLSVLSGSTWHN